MQEIPVWLEKQPKKSWFSIYSYMLCPDDEKLREMIFYYLYCKWLIASENGSKFKKEKFPTENAINNLIGAIEQKGFIEAIKHRKASVSTAAIIFRLLYSIHMADIKPSKNMAIYLYIKKFSKELFSENSTDIDGGEKNERRNLSETKIKEACMTHRDVLHFCAAQLVVDPNKHIDDTTFKRSLHKFLALSELFRKFGENDFKIRSGDKAGQSIIDSSSVFAIQFSAENIKLPSMCYKKDQIIKNLSDYTYDNKAGYEFKIKKRQPVTKS